MTNLNPYRYEPGWTIENHRDELIERLGNAIKRINILEKLIESTPHVFRPDTKFDCMVCSEPINSAIHCQSETEE